MKEIIHLGSRRELFVDDFLLMDAGSAMFVLHPPTPREDVLFRDGVADGTHIGYPTVFRDGDLIRLYYFCCEFSKEDYPELYAVPPANVPPDCKDDPLFSWPHRHYCYAESRDGIHFSKPPLGLHEFRGNKENNIVYMLPGDIVMNFSAMKDTNPDCPPDQLYKATVERVFEGKAVLNAIVSADGIHWKDVGTIISKGSFDSLNTWFWDVKDNVYRSYMRGWLHHYPSRGLGESCSGETIGEIPSQVRSITAAWSKDLVSWSEPEDLAYGAAPEYQMYTNNVQPYYRAPHIYIGMPTRFYEQPWSRIFECLPDLEEGAISAVNSKRTETWLSDAVFMSSRDGLNFKRRDYPAFLPPGPERTGNWFYGDGYIAYGLIETPSSDPGGQNEISLYATDSRRVLRRYTLRLDGFVSLRSGSAWTEILTKPLSFTGGRLVLNYATSVAGGVFVEILDDARNPIEGFSMADCDLLIGDTVDRAVTWQGGPDVSSLAGRTVHLRFRVREADLYSFCFTDENKK